MREPELRLLLERGQRCAEQSSAGTAAADVSAALEAAKTTWRTVREKANNKSAQLREVNRRAEVFHAELGMMLTWLGISENKLESVTSPSVSRDSIARQLTDIQSLQNDVERKIRDHEAVGAAARALMESGDVDQDTVSLKLTEVDNRWSQLVDGEYIVHSSHGCRSVGGQGDIFPYFLKWRGCPVFCPPLFGGRHFCYYSKYTVFIG